jgi:hypothetical protein
MPNGISAFVTPAKSFFFIHLNLLDHLVQEEEENKRAPHQHQQKFSDACVWEGGKKKSENWLINFLAIEGDSKQFSFYTKKNKK